MCVIPRWVEGAKIGIHTFQKDADLYVTGAAVPLYERNVRRAMLRLFFRYGRVRRFLQLTAL